MFNFIRAIFSLIFRSIFGEKKASVSEIQALYNSCDTIVQLSAKLIAQSYEWRSDGLNWTEGTDTFEPPALILQRKWANCSGYLRLFKEFIEYKQSPKHESYQAYVLRNQKTWHYIALIKMGDQFYCQSNMDVFVVSSIEEAIQKLPGYLTWEPFPKEKIA